MPTLQITNNGTTAVPLADLTMRYWYTYDTTPVVAQADMCNYAHAACEVRERLARTWAAVTPREDQRGLLLSSRIQRRRRQLKPGATAEFQVGFHKNDWSNFTQANDYSFNAATAFTTTTKVTVYRVGALVYGTEPP